MKNKEKKKVKRAVIMAICTNYGKRGYFPITSDPSIFENKFGIGE